MFQRKSLMATTTKKDTLTVVLYSMNRKVQISQNTVQLL